LRFFVFMDFSCQGRFNTTKRQVSTKTGLVQLDVVTIRKGGGAELFIVVATPLAADRRSLTRLQDKIEAYLQHIQSVEFQTAAGSPTPSNTTIKVMLHPDSSPEAYDLLYRSRNWVLANHATLEVEELDRGAH
jgi:hypothetical protein